MTKSFQAKLAMRVVLVMILLGIILAPVSVVSAAMRICRTDPVITLSDGVKLTLTSSVAADESEIQQVLYTVHAPVGVSVKKIEYPGGDLGGRELTVVIADGNPGKYATESVITLYNGEEVSVTYTVKVQKGKKHNESSVSGLSGDILSIIGVKP